MIDCIAPGKLPTETVILIQKLHKKYFTYPLISINSYWWFIKQEENIIQGIAGAKAESHHRIFFGPDIVLEPYRGNGIQRQLIKEREKLVSTKLFCEAVTYVKRNNLASANNYIRCGFTLCKPWLDQMEDDGSLLFFRRIMYENH